MGGSKGPESDSCRNKSSASSARPRSFWPGRQKCRKSAAGIDLTEQTFYRWRKEYGGLRTDQEKRLKELEKENTRPKKLPAESEFDKAILREAASKNF